jgi:hypothetical protein
MSLPPKTAYNYSSPTTFLKPVYDKGHKNPADQKSFPVSDFNFTW